MAVLGLKAIGIDDPKGADRKNLIVYVETDRCASDAILAVTGCHPGKRTMKILDHGKMAATFINLKTGKAVRVFAKNREGDKVMTREEIEKSPHTEEYAMMPSRRALRASGSPRRAQAGRLARKTPPHRHLRGLRRAGHGHAGRTEGRKGPLPALCERYELLRSRGDSGNERVK